MSEGELIGAGILLLSPMMPPVRRVSDNIIMLVGDTDNSPMGAPQVSADTRPLMFALS